MASYSTDLKTWGANGTEHPDGYNYLEGEQPVDEWDNWLTDNLISDIKDHLVPLTNSRVETDYGATGGEPGSPEASHLYHDQGNERLELWDSDKGAWRGLLFHDGDTMDGELDMGNYPVSGFTDLTDNNGNVVWDYSNGYIPQGRLQNDSVTVNAGTGIASGGTATLGGSLTVSVDDSRYILESGDTMGGALDLDENELKNIHRLFPKGGSTNFYIQTNNSSDDTYFSIDFSNDNVSVGKGIAGPNYPIELAGETNVRGNLMEEESRVATRTWTDNNFVSDGTDIIGTTRLDESISPTWTNQHQFSSGLDTRGDIVDDGTTIWDATNNHLEQTALENDSITVAGNSVSLGGSTGISHADLDSVSSDDHHTRFEASEVDSTNWGDYEIQKNGSDTNGVINFKT